MIPLNPFDGRARSNPYPVYQYMRTVEPVHRSPIGYWVLTRYDDCKEVLEDPQRWSHDADRLLEPQLRPGDPVDPLVRVIRSSVAFSDATAHRRHRRALETALSPAVRAIPARATETADRLVDLMLERDGRADLMTAYSAALPLSLLGEIVGLPAGDLRQVHHWGRELAAGLDPAVQPAGVIRAGSAAMAIVEYMLQQVDGARAGTTEGLVANLVSAKSSKLTTWELIADLTVFLVIGVEASCALIGNAMLALLKSPDQLQKLRRDPALIDLALEELVRFDGPIHLTARVANEDVTVGGARVAKGEQALVLLGAANRDPARFREPDRLDLAREDNAHLGFGAGPHACFAAALARSIGKAAITVLLRRLNRLELDGEPAWNNNVTLRGLSKLPVAFGA